jgi:hypothetical protein
VKQYGNEVLNTPEHRRVMADVLKESRKRDGPSETARWWRKHRRDLDNGFIEWEAPNK